MPESPTPDHQPLTPNPQPLLIGIGVTLFALVLYILTLAPSVMPGDYAEFQMSAAVLGVPHPTGYPFYIMLSKLFTLLPFGDVATFHVKPRRDAQGGDMTAQMWIAPSLQYLPVRILIRQDDQTFVDLMLEKPPLQAAR